MFYYYADSQPDDYTADTQSQSATSSSPCSQSHRASLNLKTLQGGTICLTCFSNLITHPRSPTVHVSYALSQLSRALSDPPFLHTLLSFHSHFLISPLVSALSEINDDPIARQIIDLISDLCEASGEDGLVCGDFIARVSDLLSSGALAWSRRQVHTLHCFGVLLNCKISNPYAHIKDKNALLSNLVSGLQLPSEEIRGEILFVLFKLVMHQYTSKDADGADDLQAYIPNLLVFALEALLKTENDDVRLNCIALLNMFAQRGEFLDASANDISKTRLCEEEGFMQPIEETMHERSLNTLFAEAIKGPLLSSETQVQIGSLDLIFHYISWEGVPIEQTEVLVEENIADYVFEILRLSENKDPVVIPCLKVLDLLSTAEQSFKPRLAIGFTTLIPVLHYVADIPLHAVQSQTLKLILNCISGCPGIVSISQSEDIGRALTKMFKRHTEGEMGMLPETYAHACSIFVTLMKSSSHATMSFITLLQDATKNALLACLSVFRENPVQFLYSLYLLKEAYAYGYQDGNAKSLGNELSACILDLCKTNLLPWLVGNIIEIENEEIILGVLETLHSIILQDSDKGTAQFADILVSSNWFNLSFHCFGLFPTEKMKLRIYLLLSSIADVVLERGSGQSIKDTASQLPCDPMDLLFLLSRNNTHDPELSSCQTAVLLMLYISSMYDQRLADEKLVLSSLEQYIILNSNFLRSNADSATTVHLVNLYGVYRNLAKQSYQIPYSMEAERIIFQLMLEKEWDLLSARTQPNALKWLFRQDKISELLCFQLLKFCRSLFSNGTMSDNSQYENALPIAELVASSDNHGAMLLVCLLKQLAVDDAREDDVISVIHTMTIIVTMHPRASTQLCLHGIGDAIQNLFLQASQFSCQKLVLMLVFNILCSVQPEDLSDDEGWLGLTGKLIDYVIPMLGAKKLRDESLLVISILSLILWHSTNGALTEASKAVLLNPSLVSAIKYIIHASCSKGPAIDDHAERNGIEDAMTFVLLLEYFSLKSLPAVLPGFLNWCEFFDSSNGTALPTLIVIRCHDLCRLIHFGSLPIKLVASYCLLELFIRISEETSRQNVLKCSNGYLISVMAVLEGLVYYSDIRVAINCSLCLSVILTLECETSDMQEMKYMGKNHWGRFIVEELAMSLAVPCLASKSFIDHHKAAIHLAIALLKLQKSPEWMRIVFDETSISCILENLLASKVSTEMVLLFRELLNAGYLNDDHLSRIKQVLQACRKRLYLSNNEDDYRTEGHMAEDLDRAGGFLIQLMSSQTSLTQNSGSSRCGNMRFLEEIDLFFKSTMDQDD